MHRYLLPALLLLAVLTITPACESEIQRHPQTLAGIQHFVQGRYSEAIAAFHQALKQRQDDYETYHYMARSYLYLGEYARALRTIELAIETAPDEGKINAELHEILGSIHAARYTSRAYAQIEVDDAAAAVAAFAQAVVFNPSRATAHYNLALLHAYRDSTALAEQSYLAALKADSTLAPAYKKLGKIHRERGDANAAVSAFTKAVHYDPEDAETYFLLGLSYRDLVQYEAALVNLEKAAVLNPTAPKIRLNLGNVYFRLGRREEGRREMAESERLRQSLGGMHAEISLPSQRALSIGSARDHYNMGLRHAMAGKRDQALLEFRRTIAIKPEHKDAHTALGALLYEQGRLDEATHYFSRAVVLDPEDPIAYLRLGNIYERLGNYQGAHEVFTQATQLDSNIAEAFHGLGITSTHLDRPDEAVTHFARAIALNPDYAEALFALGVAYMKLEEIEKAVSAYQRVITLDPDNARAHLYLSDAFKRLDRMDEGAEHYQRARALLDKEGLTAAPADTSLQ